MRLKTFEHLEPRTLSEACSLLAAHGAKGAVIAGGTDLVVRMKYGVTTPDVLINIKRVEGIGEIGRVGDELHIGAAATLTDVQRSAMVREHFPILVEAALGVGAAQLQNMGTLGGNICLEPRCWYYQQSPSWRQARPSCLKNGGAVCYMAKGSKRCHALYCGDTAAALLVLGARVRLASSAGERTVPLERFFVDDGMRHTVLRHDEILAEVIIPLPWGGERATYLKYRKRGAVDFPIVGVGALLREEAGLSPQIRIAVTGAGSLPFLVAGLQELVAGQELTGELTAQVAQSARKQTKPVSNMEVSAAYRKQLVEVLVKDALEKLLLR
jgi:4-hydroxybenzoyl-CoA reductase subunit beta